EHYERALQFNPKHAGAAAKLGETTKLVRRAASLSCEFRLHNQTKVKAELLMPDFTVRTPAGMLLIPTDEIDIIELGVPPQPDRIVSNAYTGEGFVRAEIFSAKSKFGPIEVKRVDVQSIRMLRPCDECEGKGQLKCRRCAGAGKLTDKSVCPDCNGKGWEKCQRCDGKGKVVCPLCGGRGRFYGAWGRMRSANCPRCNGAGVIDCPDCDRGRVVCKTCKGKPSSTKAGPCPVCGGKGVVDCAVCGGTGVKPLPAPEPPAEAPPETPPVTPPDDPDAPRPPGENAP
ncbi:MAG TPA: hypothetical protein VMX57_07795, partial [Planctomycetota bacterium]|nr:hypothetical protein [Planctomycetota bacterium]